MVWAEAAAEPGVVAAAGPAGRVVRFEHVVPSLSDLFREVVRS